LQDGRGRRPMTSLPASYSVMCQGFRPTVKHGRRSGTVTCASSSGSCDGEVITFSSQSLRKGIGLLCAQEKNEKLQVSVPPCWRRMKLRVRVGKRSGRLELTDDEVTLRDLRWRLRQTFLPSLGFSSDAVFSITLNGRDPLLEDESSLQSLGIISGDLIVVVTDETPPPVPAHEEPPAPSAALTYTRQEDERGAAAPGGCDVAGSSQATVEEEAVSCAPGPMLCSEASDGEIPHSLEALYLSSDCTSANDALVIVT
ncbi:hypothetical protein GDO81_024925, partial [Engystomops pustulosus]